MKVPNMTPFTVESISQSSNTIMGDFPPYNKNNKPSSVITLQILAAATLATTFPVSVPPVKSSFLIRP